MGGLGGGRWVGGWVTLSPIKLSFTEAMFSSSSTWGGWVGGWVGGGRGEEGREGEAYYHHPPTHPPTYLPTYLGDFLLLSLS